MPRREDPSPHRDRKPNGGLEIREMALEDLPQVYALGEELFTADRWPNLYRTWDEYELVEFFSTSGDFCLVAELHGRVVGFAIGQLIEKRRSAWVYGYLVWLGVDPKLERGGIGARLTNRLQDLFIEYGARMMLVDTATDNVAALSFFRKQGYGSENPHVYLSKNLTREAGYRRLKGKTAPRRGSARGAVRERP